MLLPAALLGESLFTGDRYLPYDVAEFPPIAQTLTPEQLAEIRSTANYDATEAPIWFAIELQLAREAFAAGQLPHWDPYVRCGAPLLAHGHTGFMNPLHLPALLFADPADGLLYLTYAMFALAGMLMFGFLRAMRLGTAAAAFGAVAFAWSGTMTANGHWYMRMEPLAMLPGMLWAIVALVERSGWARALPAAGLAAATAFTWLSGFPQYGIPVTLLAGAFGLVFITREMRDGKGAALRLLLWLGGAGLLGMLLAMPQLLQMLYFYPLSNRPIDEAFDRATRHAFAPFGLLGYVMPEAFSHPNDAALPQTASPLPYLWSDLRHWNTGEVLAPNYNFTEYALFPGVLPLALAVLALAIRGPRWRWFPALALAAVWLLATGAFGARYAYHLPGIKAVPPYRFAGPACALLAMLAAVGFDGLRRRLRPWSMRALALALAVGAIAMFALSSSAEPAKTAPDDPWLVEISERYRDVLAAEYHAKPAQVTPAAALAYKFSPNDRTRPGSKSDAISLARQRFDANLRRGAFGLLLGAGLLVAFSFLRREGGLRGWPTAVMFGLAGLELAMFSFALNRGQACEHDGDTAVHTFLAAERDARKGDGGMLVGRGIGGPYNLPGGTLAAAHIRDLNYYTFVDNKSDLPLRRLYGDDFILRGFVCDAVPDDERLERPYWDLMGLRYVLATRPMSHAGERVGPTAIGGADYFVYERPNVLPRAWLVPLLTVVDDEQQLVTRLASPDLDPRAGVFVGSADAERLGGLAPGDGPADRTIRFTFEDTKRVTLEVAAGSPGYLVIADTCFPGQSATWNGAPIEIARGNLFQRVVKLPAEAGVLEFRFRAQGFVAGLAIGGIALLGWVALLGVGTWIGVRNEMRPRRPAGDAADIDGV
ncbi:MAG: hypothetical protein KDE27_29775 [Planctomycetes bacterium]|nr:hypothetical protein [Planctomycetota bacterium]